MGKVVRRQGEISRLTLPPHPSRFRALFAGERRKYRMSTAWGNITWSFCYFLVLLGLSLYGLHRYVILYLYFKYRNRAPMPAAQFEQLPRITVQLPIYNEMYVVERLLKAVAELDYPRDLLQVQ